MTNNLIATTDSYHAELTINARSIPSSPPCFPLNG
jgi:hypothetical protein